MRGKMKSSMDRIKTQDAFCRTILFAVFFAYGISVSKK